MKTLRITVDGKVYEVTVEVVGQETGAPVPSLPTLPQPAAASPQPAVVLPTAAAPAAAPSGNTVNSPLSAVVVSVDCAPGQTIKKDQKLITLEAMKMNTFVNAPADGTIKEILVQPGNSVREGQPLVSLA